MAKTTWKQYFSVIKIIPGPVIVPGRGLIDFSNPNIPVQTIQELYEDDCPYLRITPQGFEALYGNSPDVASPIPIPHPQSQIEDHKSPIEDDQSSIVNRKSSVPPVPSVSPDSSDSPVPPDTSVPSVPYIPSVSPDTSVPSVPSHSRSSRKPKIRPSPDPEFSSL